MLRVGYPAGVSTSVLERVANTSPRRRDLRQQTSRIALMSVIGLAAAAGASLLTPDQALAQCTVGFGLRCEVPTVTTDTKFSGAPAPVDRFYEFATGAPFAALVATGVTVSGHGLAISNTGGVDVVNDGVIRIDAGNQPIEGGSSALNLTSGGGAITYRGGGDIINEATFDGFARQGLQVIQGGAGLVDINTSGKIFSAGGDGVFVFDVADSTGISVVTGDVTSVAGAGLRVSSRSEAGDVRVVAEGDVSADETGVVVRLSSANSTGDVDVTTVGSVVGARGIEAENSGSGSTTVNAAGPVVATAGEGIFAFSTAGDVTVVAADVTASDDGIEVRQLGVGVGDVTVSAGRISGANGIIAANGSEGGAVTVTTTGAITGTTGSGIEILAKGAVTLSVADTVTGAVDGLRIEAGDDSVGDISVTGAGGFVGLAGDAVNILNEGSGTVTVDVSGPITATGGSGVVVRDTPIGGDISVTTGDVTATDLDAVAIDVLSRSETADVTVVANGDLRGSTNNTAVRAEISSSTATGDINVTTRGSIDAAHGIRVSNDGSGSSTVTAAGPITVSGRGIEVDSEGGDITVTASGPIIGADGGIDVDSVNGDIVVTASGPITTTDGIGIDAESDTGDITVTTTGSITTTGDDGIEAESDDGAITVTASGPINATDGFGIDVDSDGGAITVTATGAITATGSDGIRVASDGGDIAVTAGDITANDGVAIRVAQFGGSTGDIAVTTTGSVLGALGILATSFATGADISITTNGKVTGLTDEGILATGRGDISVSVADTVTGGTRALGLSNISSGSGDISVTGAGGFVGLNGDAVNIENRGSGSVLFDVSGPISATGGHGVRILDTAIGGDTRITTGAVTASGPGSRAIDFASQSTAGDITIVANGDLNADVIGVSARLGSAASGDIDVTTNGSVTAHFGIDAINFGSGSATVTARGPITAINGDGITAISGRGDVTVIAGDVTATGGRGITADRFDPGTGVVSVTAGKVSGETGIFAANGSDGATNVTANGAVTGVDGFGIVILGQGEVNLAVADTVTGSIGGLLVEGGLVGGGDISITGAGGFAGLSGDAVNILNEGSGTITFDASGPISATNGNGVFIRDTSAGGDISVTTGAVTATTATFNAINVISASLTGNVNVVSNGVLKGGNWGVIADISPGVATGDITVTTNAAIEAGQGIRALNFGSGSVGILAAGPITATTGVGVRAQTAGGAIDITTGAITSANVGILAVHVGAGTGAISVVANGPVNSTTSDGAFLQGNGAISLIADGLVSGQRGLTLDGGRGGAGDIAVAGTGGFAGLNGDAVNILNSGSGNVLFDVSGPITATGGNGIVVRDTRNGGDISVTTGGVAATDANMAAIDIRSISRTGGITVVADGDLRGGIVGVSASLGSGGTATGDINVTTRGSVTAAGGIFSMNQGSGSITVTAAGPIVAGGFGGVFAQASGGDITVNAGDVTSVGGAGIILRSAGEGSINLTTGNVSGVLGIAATGDGGGAISITANGAVTGTAIDEGIRVTGRSAVSVAVADRVSGGRNGLSLTGGTGGSGDISVTGAGGFVGGTQDAARIVNNGSGNVLFDVSGPITSTRGNGVFIRDTAAGGDISVTAGEVTAATATFNAINVFSASTTADVNIVANGVLRGGNWGVITRLLPADAIGDMTVVTTAAIEAGQGVQALNFGSGSVVITTAGPITATTGLGVQAQTAGGAIDITTGAVTSAGVGIQALQTGTGAGGIAIAANGAVTSATAAGILATGGDIQIDVRDVKGATAGISTNNNGVGSTDIRVRGTVEGGTNAINAFSSGDQAVNILNEGVIRNSSAASSAIALGAAGGLVTLTNAGTLLGGVILGADSSRFQNQGSWNSVGGDSIFAGGDDRLANATGGSILGTSGADVLDLTLWRGLETFENSGRIALSDGGGGDAVITSANALFLDGSVLEVDIGGANGSDAFATSGTLDIQTGSRLAVNIVQPLALNFRYVVAQADDGLTGRFELEDRLLTAFVGLRDGYTDTTAFIEVAQLRALAEAGITPNQRETAAGADSLPDDNALRTALLLLPDDTAAIEAFDQLSGEIHPAARKAMADDSRLPRDAVLDRLDDGRRDGSAWGRAFIEERVSDADLNAAKMERDTGGVLFGVDHALGDNLTLGVAAGRFNTDLSIIARNSTGSMRTTQGLVYLGGRLGQWGVKAGLGYAATSTATRREISFPGVNASPAARYDGSVLQGFIDAGYRIPLHGGYLEPFASLTTIRAKTDAFAETQGPAALSGEANTDDLTVSTAGLRFSTGVVGPFSLQGSAGLRSLSGDLDPDGRHAFDGGTTFTVLGAAQSDRAAVVDVEAQWRLAPNITLGVAYDGVMGTEGQDHSVSGRFRFAF